MRLLLDFLRAEFPVNIEVKTSNSLITIHDTQARIPLGFSQRRKRRSFPLLPHSKRMDRCRLRHFPLARRETGRLHGTFPTEWPGFHPRMPWMGKTLVVDQRSRSGMPERDGAFVDGP